MSATSTHGFERLLALLDADPERAGERFRQLRERLVRLFLWRGARDPDALADETIDRVSAKMAAGVAIEAKDPFHYLAGFARRVALEAYRHEAREQQALESAGREPARGTDDEHERRLACLDQCMERLNRTERAQILRFYRGEKGERIAGRKALAREMGISANALRIRAHRWRTRLERCVRACLGIDESPSVETENAPPSPRVGGAAPSAERHAE